MPDAAQCFVASPYAPPRPPPGPQVTDSYRHMRGPTRRVPRQRRRQPPLLLPPRPPLPICRNETGTVSSPAPPPLQCGTGLWHRGGAHRPQRSPIPIVLAAAPARRLGQGCIRREGVSAAPEAVRQAVGGGCQSGWGRLLSVTTAIEAGTAHATPPPSFPRCRTATTHQRGPRSHGFAPRRSTHSTCWPLHPSHRLHQRRRGTTRTTADESNCTRFHTAKGC